MNLEHLTRDELARLLESQLELTSELRVHQVELELQNQELHDTHSELARSRDRYLQLYESAPLAYVTLAENFAIEAVNHRAALLFGRERKSLVGRAFMTLLDESSVATLTALISQCREQAGVRSAELQLREAGRTVQVVLQPSRDQESG